MCIYIHIYAYMCRYSFIHWSIHVFIYSLIYFFIDNVYIYIIIIIIIIYIYVLCVINQLGMITPYKSLQTPRSASEVALRDEQKRDPHAGSNHQNGNLCRFRRADIGEMHYVTMCMYTPGISQIKKPEKKRVETLSPVLRWRERRGILLGCLGPRESPVRTPGGLKWSNWVCIKLGTPKTIGFPWIPCHFYWSSMLDYYTTKICVFSIIMQ